MYYACPSSVQFFSYGLNRYVDPRHCDESTAILMSSAVSDLVTSSETLERTSYVSLSVDDSIAIGHAFIDNSIMSASDLARLCPETTFGIQQLKQLAYDLPVMLVMASRKKYLLLSLSDIRKDSQLLTAVLELASELDEESHQGKSESPSSPNRIPGSGNGIDEMTRSSRIPTDEHGELRPQFGPKKRQGRPRYADMFPDLIKTATQFIESVGVSAQARRRDESCTALGATLADITKALKSQIPGMSDCLLSTKTIKYHMMPPKTGTCEGDKHTAEIPAKVPHTRNNATQPTGEAHTNISQVNLSHHMLTA